MLAFTSVYFLEFRFFNGLRAFGVKKFPGAQSPVVCNLFAKGAEPFSSRRNLAGPTAIVIAWILNYRNYFLALIALAGGRLPVGAPPNACRHGRACPGHPRSAASKTRPTLPRAGAKQTRLSELCRSLLVMRCAEPRGWPGQARPGRLLCRRWSLPQFRVPRSQQRTL
jgi:hypothetical protein